MLVISHGELFDGKICAALDRQHPRDLLDVHYLLSHEGITTIVKQGFIAALLSHPRPIHEVLNPNWRDQSDTFASQFRGMTILPFTYTDLEETQHNLYSYTLEPDR